MTLADADMPSSASGKSAFPRPLLVELKCGRELASKAWTQIIAELRAVGVDVWLARAHAPR